MVRRRRPPQCVARKTIPRASRRCTNRSGGQAWVARAALVGLLRADGPAAAAPFTPATSSSIASATAPPRSPARPRRRSSMSTCPTGRWCSPSRSRPPQLAPTNASSPSGTAGSDGLLEPLGRRPIPAGHRLRGRDRDRSITGPRPLPRADRRQDHADGTIDSSRRWPTRRAAPISAARPRLTVPPSGSRAAPGPQSATRLGVHFLPATLHDAVELSAS